MQNWYQKFRKTSQAATDESARNERMNAVSAQLTQEIFPKFANEVGVAIQDRVNDVVRERVDTYANQIPQVLQLTSYNLESMKTILRAMAANAAQISLQNSLKNTKQDAWTLLGQNTTFIQQCITEFFRTVYTPTEEELESLKLTMAEK